MCTIPGAAGRKLSASVLADHLDIARSGGPDMARLTEAGQGEMIPAFRMPNPDWEGCGVGDPSARALSNDGNSGS